MDAYATAADLARIYHVKTGTIYAWASFDGWRRTRTRPRRYHCGDAQASWDKRHTAADVAQPHEQQARLATIESPEVCPWNPPQNSRT